MAYVFVTIVVLAVVALAGFGVVAFFQSGAASALKQVRSTKAELANANERVSIAQTALIEIASGDAMPVLRASEALANITRTYTKEI